MPSCLPYEVSYVLFNSCLKDTRVTINRQVSSEMKLCRNPGGAIRQNSSNNRLLMTSVTAIISKRLMINGKNRGTFSIPVVGHHTSTNGLVSPCSTKDVQLIYVFFLSPSRPINQSIKSGQGTFHWRAVSAVHRL